MELDELRDAIARANIERLSKFEPPSEPEDAPDYPLPQCEIALGLLEKWSADNASIIQQAMEFVNLCDLATEHPDGHVDWDGPYCGAFITTAAPAGEAPSPAWPSRAPTPCSPARSP